MPSRAPWVAAAGILAMLGDSPVRTAPASAGAQPAVSAARRPRALLQAGGRMAGLVVPAFMLTLVPTLLNYRHNRVEVGIQDFAVPVAIDLATAVLVAAVFGLWRRRAPLSALLGVLTASLLLGGDFEGRLTLVRVLLRRALPYPSLFDIEAALVTLGAAIATFLLAGWLGSRLSTSVARRGMAEGWDRSLVLAVALVLAVVGAPAARDLAGAWPQFSYHPPRLVVDSQGGRGPAGHLLHRPRSLHEPGGAAGAVWL